MLVLGFILILLGLALQWWVSANANISAIYKPLIFKNDLFVISSVLLAYAVLIGGFVCLWMANPWVLACCIFVIIALRLYSRKIGSDKAKVEIVFTLYVHFKKLRPSTDDCDIFFEVLRTYFETLRWDKHETKAIMEVYYRKPSRITNVKQLANFILSFEKPLKDIDTYGWEKYSSEKAKRDKVIEAVYLKKFGGV